VATVNIDYCATDNLISGGTGNIENVNYLNELLSIDINSLDFLKPKFNSSIAKLGCNPMDIIANDFLGFSYEEPFPIGTYQLQKKINYRLLKYSNYWI